MLICVPTLLSPVQLNSIRRKSLITAYRGIEVVPDISHLAKVNAKCTDGVKKNALFSKYPSYSIVAGPPAHETPGPYDTMCKSADSFLSRQYSNE